MAKVYKNPPISEAVCEFRFEPSQTWDSTYFGLIYDRLKTNFPKKTQEVSVKVEIGARPEGPLQQILSAPPRMKFLSDDEKCIVQLASDVMSISKLKPYDNWENFKAVILSCLTAYKDVNEPKSIGRIGIRYINRIQIPEKDVQIEDYLLAVPKLPEQIPQVFDSWVQRVEVPFPKINSLLIIQSGSIREKDLDCIAFLLDFDFLIIAASEPIAISSAPEMIEIAHKEIEAAFEACITDKTRLIFNEQVEEGNG